MFVQLCDLRLKALTMGAVFGRVDRLSLEGGVFRPKRFDFLPKAVVFRRYVFALTHLRIVACRQGLCGISQIFAPDVQLMRLSSRGVAVRHNPDYIFELGCLCSSVALNCRR